MIAAASSLIPHQGMGLAKTAEEQQYAPINFFYSHFHNAIKNELNILYDIVQTLTQESASSIATILTQLKERYSFLEQVYKYHSDVEDEVIKLDILFLNLLMVYIHIEYRVLLVGISYQLSLSLYQQIRTKYC